MKCEQLEKELKLRKVVSALHIFLFYTINPETRPYPTCYTYEDQKAELKSLLKEVLK